MPGQRLSGVEVIDNSPDSWRRQTKKVLVSTGDYSRAIAIYAPGDVYHDLLWAHELDLLSKTLQLAAAGYIQQTAWEYDGVAWHAEFRIRVGVKI